MTYTAALRGGRTSAGGKAADPSAALREPNPGPAATAITALILIVIRNIIRTVRQMMPAGNFDVLKNPLVAPAFLLDFLDR